MSGPIYALVSIHTVESCEMVHHHLPSHNIEHYSGINWENYGITEYLYVNVRVG